MLQICNIESALEIARGSCEEAISNADAALVRLPVGSALRCLGEPGEDTELNMWDVVVSLKLVAELWELREYGCAEVWEGKQIHVVPAA